MTKFLLNSGIATDYIDRRFGVYERVRAEKARGNRVGIGIPGLGEIVAGLEGSATRDRNMQRLEAALPSLVLWPYDEAAAYEYGRLHAELRRLGRPMGVIDVMLAAIARVLGNCVVVTIDSDLSAVPGLKVENWRVVPQADDARLRHPRPDPAGRQRGGGVQGEGVVTCSARSASGNASRGDERSEPRLTPNVYPHGSSCISCGSCTLVTFFEVARLLYLSPL